MDLTAGDVKDVITIAKPLIEPLISSFLTPKMKKLDKWLHTKKIKQEYINDFDKKFREYLFRSYHKYSTLNVLVFPNQQIEIKDIYLPLSLRSMKDSNVYMVDIFDKKILETYSKIIISDTAGMGKSTLTKWIALSIIEQKISIPILIELKKLSKEHSILNEIYSQLDSIDNSLDRDLIIKLLEIGDFTILLDGFDEIAFENRERILLDLKEFISKAYKNWYILTSRPDSSLSAFGDFQMFHIQPLKIQT